MLEPGGGAGPPIFARSVNPIPTGWGQIIPTFYYWYPLFSFPASLDYLCMYYQDIFSSKMSFYGPACQLSRLKLIHIFHINWPKKVVKNSLFSNSSKHQFINLQFKNSQFIFFRFHENQDSTLMVKSVFSKKRVSAYEYAKQCNLYILICVFISLNVGNPCSALNHNQFSISNHTIGIITSGSIINTVWR